MNKINNQCSALIFLALLCVSAGGETIHRSGFETLEPAQLVGTWSAIGGDVEQLADIRADGSYSVTVDDYVKKTSAETVGRWRVENALAVFTPNGSEDLYTAAEILDSDSFRLTGHSINLNAGGISSLLYRRIGFNDGQFERRWLIGGWFNFRGSLRFHEDGSYTLTVEPYLLNPERIETGRWSFTLDRLQLTPEDGDAYQVEINLLGLNTPALGFTSLTRGVLLADTIAAYAGQFGGPETTVVINPDGTGYAIYDELGRRDLTARLSADRIRATLTLEGYDKTFDANLRENGLRVLDSLSSGSRPPFGFPDELIKLAERETLPPDDLTGIWYLDYSFVSDTQYWLTSIGRMFTVRSVSTSRADIVIADDSITIDTDCDGTSRYGFEQVGNQMIFKASDFALNLVYVPGSPPVVERELRQSAAAEAELTRIWDARLTTAIVQPAQLPASVVGPLDLNWQDVFPNARVFAELEGYYWQEYLFGYALTASGYVQVSPFSEFPNDIIEGPFYNQQLYTFLDNGRVYIELKNYGIPDSLSPVTPNVTGVWQRYKIEGETIVVGDETLGLVGGKRRIIRDSPDSFDFCYDNVKWAAEKTVERRPGRANGHNTTGHSPKRP